jgi:hypothetical protein
MPQDSTGEVLARCPNDCKEALAMANEEVDLMRRIADPVQRNIGITSAYQALGRQMPNNWWVRLAGYVSVQGGCAMKRTLAWDAQTVGRAVVNPEQAYAALGDANLTIFESVYPPNKFMNACGYARLKECVERGEIKVNKKIMDALAQIDAGNLRAGANILADHEQRDVVQPVYERHAATFGDLATAEGLLPGDQTSIPIAYECTRIGLVPIGRLNIADPNDRVTYYGRLMDRMMELEGLR